MDRGKETCAYRRVGSRTADPGAEGAAPVLHVVTRHHQVLRRCDDRWMLAHRKIMVDESVLRMQNLAVFL